MFVKEEQFCRFCVGATDWLETRGILMLLVCQVNVNWNLIVQ